MLRKSKLNADQSQLLHKQRAKRAKLARTIAKALFIFSEHEHFPSRSRQVDFILLWCRQPLVVLVCLLRRKCEKGFLLYSEITLFSCLRKFNEPIYTFFLLSFSLFGFIQNLRKYFFLSNSSIHAYSFSFWEGWLGQYIWKSYLIISTHGIFLSLSIRFILEPTSISLDPSLPSAISWSSSVLRLRPSSSL